MLDAVAVVLLGATGEGASPTVAAMAGAARDTLGAAVEVRESSGVPTDAEALGAQRARNAAAVVEVMWDEPAPAQGARSSRIARRGEGPSLRHRSGAGRFGGHRRVGERGGGDGRVPVVSASPARRARGRRRADRDRGSRRGQPLRAERLGWAGADSNPST